MLLKGHSDCKRLFILLAVDAATVIVSGMATKLLTSLLFRVRGECSSFITELFGFTSFGVELGLVREAKSRGYKAPLRLNKNVKSDMFAPFFSFFFFQ